MKFLRLNRDNNTYWCNDTNSIELTLLVNFLRSDVGCYSSSFKEWALDLQLGFTGSNFSFLEKEGNYIYLWCNFEPDGPRLKIHRDELVKILDAWEQFCKTKPKEITIIKEDDDTFTIEAKN